MNENILTAERLRKLLSYDKTTGLFVRLETVGKGSKSKKGAVLGGKQNSKSGYCQIMVEGFRSYAHRLAWLHFYGNFPNHCIDHIDGNKVNNRIENLRDSSVSINTQNQKKPQRNNKSGYLGVSKHKCGKFSACIWLNGKSKYIGLYDTAKEAHEAYLNAKRSLHLGCTL